MKFLIRYPTFLSHILRLRYGTQSPIRNQQASFSIQAVAKYLQISFQEAQSIESKYFRDLKKKSKAPQLSKVEIEFLTNETFLKDNCSKSLEVRARIFKKEFPNSNLTRQNLGKLYKNCNIKQKKVLRVAANPKKYSKEYCEQYLDNMRKSLVELDEQGYDILEVDESLFSGQDVRRKAWSLPHRQIRYQHLSRHLKLFGVMAAVSSQNEGICHLLKQGYFNSEDTIEFLQMVQRQNVGRKIAIFWDNCSIHNSKKVKQYLLHIKLPTVMNLPYSPQFNGIEFIWSQMKSKFRNQLADLKTQQLPFDVQSVIENIIQNMEGKIIYKCAAHGWKNIFNSQQNLISLNMFQNVKIQK